MHRFVLYPTREEEPMSINGLKARMYLAGATIVPTALAVYALAAPLNDPH